MKECKNLYVPLSGRFGNQLFQLCAALYLAQTRDFPMRLDARGTRPRNILLLLKTGLVSRHELILDFKQKIFLSKLPFSWILDVYVGLKSFIKYRLERLGLPKKMLNLFKREILYIEDEKWKVLDQVNDRFYGYFQNSDLVDQVWSELKSRFENSKLGTLDFNNSTREVVLHVRLTDYFLHPEIGVLEEKYYLKCLLEFANHRVTVITDDEKSFELYFPNLSKISNVYINANDSLSSFAYMCNADILIIANSSFSYWAGIFSLMRNSSARIIAPDLWRVDGKSNCILHKNFLLKPRER